MRAVAVLLALALLVRLRLYQDGLSALRPVVRRQPAPELAPAPAPLPVPESWFELTSMEKDQVAVQVQEEDEDKEEDKKEEDNLWDFSFDL